MSTELRGQIPEGDYLAFEFFQVWEASGYNQLPFPGAWVDQPTWVTNAFRWFQRVARWHDINKKLTRSEELPSSDDVFR